MGLLSDNALEKLERARTYLVVDIIFNWIGGAGEFLLLVYVIFVWHRSSENLSFGSRFWFWSKVLFLSVILLSVRSIKDEVLAWAGIAPPDYLKWFGPHQEPCGLPGMQVIIDAQQRGTRISHRGIRVDQLLAENEAIFQRKQGKHN